MQELLNQYSNLCAKLGQLKHQESVLIKQLDLVASEIAKAEQIQKAVQASKKSETEVVSE